MQTRSPDQAKEYYRTCLQDDFRNCSPLNHLASYYEGLNKPYVALLCRLASLLVDPGQEDLYQAAQSSYESGTLDAEQFRFANPCTCRVSIVVATHNRPMSLPVALKSILDQSFQDFEVVVINNGGDNTAQEIVSSLNSTKIRYLYEPRPGQYVATNTAIRETRGEYIAYLDDDDIFYPNHLETLYNSIKSYGTKIIYGRNRWVKGKWVNGCWVEEQDITKYTPYNVNHLYGSCIIANQNSIHHRSVIEEVGLYQDQPERGCDWEFRVRCSRFYNIPRIDAVTSEVRLPNVLSSKKLLQSQFYAQLWPIYFRSGFGELILAIASWANGEKRKAWEHIEKIDTWQYMSKRSLEALWIYLARISPFERDYLLEKLSRYQPVWLAKKMLVAPPSLFNVKPKYWHRALTRAVNQLVFRRK